MRHTLSAVLIAAACCFAPRAAPAAEPPSPEMVRELLAASDARALLDASVGEMRKSLDGALAGAMQDSGRHGMVVHLRR